MIDEILGFELITEFFGGGGGGGGGGSSNSYGGQDATSFNNMDASYRGGGGGGGSPTGANYGGGGGGTPKASTSSQGTKSSSVTAYKSDPSYGGQDATSFNRMDTAYSKSRTSAGTGEAKGFSSAGSVGDGLMSSTALSSRVAAMPTARYASLPAPGRREDRVSPTWAGAPVAERFDPRLFSTEKLSEWKSTLPEAPRDKSGRVASSFMGDGLFGPSTAEAAQRFRKDRPITPTGRLTLDPEYIRTLNPRQQMIAGAQRIADRFGGSLTPEDVLTMISYETAGSFRPDKAGGVTQHGRHRGLIQWGEPQAKQYGVDLNGPVIDQMEAAAQYLEDRGLRPGMGILEAYAAINAGRADRFNATDENNGGDRGTVREKVDREMGANSAHRAKARAVLSGEKGGVLSGREVWADLRNADGSISVAGTGLGGGAPAAAQGTIGYAALPPDRPDGIGQTPTPPSNRRGGSQAQRFPSERPADIPTPPRRPDMSKYLGGEHAGSQAQRYAPSRPGSAPLPPERPADLPRTTRFGEGATAGMAGYDRFENPGGGIRSPNAPFRGPEGNFSMFSTVGTRAPNGGWPESPSTVRGSGATPATAYVRSGGDPIPTRTVRTTREGPGSEPTTVPSSQPPGRERVEERYTSPNPAAGAPAPSGHPLPPERPEGIGTQYGPTPVPGHPGIQKVVPHIVDGLISVVPGVGMINGLSAALGGPSIGGLFAKGRPGNDFTIGTREQDTHYGGSDDAPPRRREPEKEVKDARKRVEEKYIKLPTWDAPTWLDNDFPTPSERWVTHRDHYRPPGA